jgi:hypothetical protein
VDTLKRGVLAAAAGAVQAERAIGGACPATRTDFGVDLRHLRSDASSGAGSSKSPFWNKQFGSFFECFQAPARQSGQVFDVVQAHAKVGRVRAQAAQGR